MRKMKRLLDRVSSEAALAVLRCKSLTFNITLGYSKTANNSTTLSVAKQQEVINFLLTTEIIPLCLRIMESGSELSKTVATFILQKILLDDTGLSYICQTFERFSHAHLLSHLGTHTCWPILVPC